MIFLRNIAIIDDRAEERKILNDRIKHELKKLNITCDIVDFEPLPNIEDYPQWILDNKIDILIVDERLNTQKLTNGSYSIFNGHELITYIRKYNIHLPIFVITAYKETNELLSTVGNIDNIISRANFHKYSAEYIKTIIRVSNRYFEAYQKEFLQLSQLSEKIAKGTATAQEVDETRALQEKLQIPMTANFYNDRAVWMNQFESKINDIASISSSIENFLKEVEQ